MLLVSFLLVYVSLVLCSVSLFFFYTWFDLFCDYNFFNSFFNPLALWYFNSLLQWLDIVYTTIISCVLISSTSPAHVWPGKFLFRTVLFEQTFVLLKLTTSPAVRMLPLSFLVLYEDLFRLSLLLSQTHTRTHSNNSLINNLTKNPSIVLYTFYSTINHNGLLVECLFVELYHCVHTLNKIFASFQAMSFLSVAQTWSIQCCTAATTRRFKYTQKIKDKCKNKYPNVCFMIIHIFEAIDMIKSSV